MSGAGTGRGVEGEGGEGQQAVLGTLAKGQQLVTVNKPRSAGGASGGSQVST